MHHESRRNFVKKSLATSMTVTFGGLIAAHGEEGGTTTNTTTENTTLGTEWTTDDSTAETTLGTDVTTEFTSDTTIGTDVTTEVATSTVPETIGTEVTTAVTQTGTRGEDQYQYRVICYESPDDGSTIVSWAEATSVTATPKSISVRAVTTGPARGQASLSVLGGSTLFSYSENGINDEALKMTKTVSKELELQAAPYTGQWIAEGRPTPEIVTKWSDNKNAQPGDAGIVYGVGGEIGHSLSVNKAGIFLSSLAVTGGQNYFNQSGYTTTDNITDTTHSGAAGTLAAPDVSLEINPKKISGKAEIKNKTGVTISSDGTLISESVYNRTVDAQGKVSYTYSGTCTSSVVGTGKTKFLVMMQKRHKRVVYTKYSDGSEVMTDDGNGNISAWSPPLPPVQE